MPAPLTAEPARGGDMVERVARAICIGQGYDPDKVGESIDGSGYFGEATWKFFSGDARAAIEALIEPTDAMKVNGGLAMEHELFERGDDGPIFDAAGRIFRVMIGAALGRRDLVAAAISEASEPSAAPPSKATGA